MKIKAFSLIELLVVVSILGIIAAIAVPQYINYSAKTKILSAFNSTEKIQQEMKVYYTRTGSWPTNGAELNYSAVNYTGPGGVTAKPNCFTTAPPSRTGGLTNNSTWGSPYINTVCMYTTTRNGYPAGRLDVIIDVSSVGITARSGWNDIQHSKIFWVDSTGTMNTACFEGGGSPYSDLFPDSC